jgi:NAD(P)-dependent dehydrogenase (short-subunit alcohol dehydrogenase family)
VRRCERKRRERDRRIHPSGKRHGQGNLRRRDQPGGHPPNGQGVYRSYGRIDVVDYNVGLAHVGDVVELPEEEWDRIFALNLKVCYLTMKQVIPIMEKQGGGSIINISSVAGIRYTGVPFLETVAHSAVVSERCGEGWTIGIGCDATDLCNTQAFERLRSARLLLHKC